MNNFWSFFAALTFTALWLIALYEFKNHKKQNKNFDSLMESIAIFKRQHQIEKDEIYRERNILVALLAQTYPSGIKKTAIDGWSPEWHNCVYIELPDGSQCSWHYHDDDSYLFENLPPYEKEWDGHTTENKYFNIEELILSGSIKKITRNDGIITTITSFDNSKK